MPESLCNISIDSFLSIITGFIGTVIGFVITLIAQRSNNHSNRKNMVEEHQVREYLQALEYACDAYDALRGMGMALSGRTEPDERSSAEDKEESMRRDQESADALNRLYQSLGLLSRQSFRICAIGSEKIRTAANEVNAAVDEYLDNAYRKMLVDGKFIARDFTDATTILRERIWHLAEVIRKELKIEELLK